MQFLKFFIVFVALIERSCVSKAMIQINKSNRFADLQEAAINTLIKCYTNRDKTVVLLGDYSGNFIQLLSSHELFSLILQDNVRRAEHNNDKQHTVDETKRHKIHIVVIIASHAEKSWRLLLTLRSSLYTTNEASVLVLKWSPETKNRRCDRIWDNTRILFNSKLNNLLNTNLLCRDRENRVIIYGYNPFTSYAPKPWRFVRWVREKSGIFRLFTRKYRQYEEMCKNIDFEKTNNLGGSAIETMHTCWFSFGCTGYDDGQHLGWRWIEKLRNIEASQSKLYISPGCVGYEYICNALPFKWALEERFNKFLDISISGGFIMPLEAIVYEKRRIEMDTEEPLDDPRVMTFLDLRFAFIILGIGLFCALLVFIAEKIIYRF